MNGRDYIANVINLSKNIMEQKVKVFVYVKWAKRTMLIRYRTELDVSQVLNPKEAQDYQQLVGISRWIFELGRVDTVSEVSLLSIHLSMPHKGHMELLMVIFVYLDKAYGKTILVDPIIPKFNTSMEIEKNWPKNIYGEDNQEEIPANPLEPLGNTMSVNIFLDASHAGENMTYHSLTGIFIYVNNTLIY